MKPTKAYSSALLLEVSTYIVACLALTFLWNGFSDGNWTISSGDVAQWIFAGLMFGIVSGLFSVWKTK